jgi:3,4-dihydroxy 2-butanone 4-phosphate synthase/GTP cyclohydrolase II
MVHSFEILGGIDSMSKIPLKRQAEALLPTDWGQFRMIAYARRSDDPLPHLAMVHENTDFNNQPILLRVHSECMTGDVFHSARCDCGEQLDFAMRKAAAEGGIVIYLRQEGRGIGLINKLRAYNLQDKGFNTAEANLRLGFKADERRYEDALTILNDLNVKKVRLLTNNPLKMTALTEGGIEIVSREPIVIEPKAENEFYLHTKKDIMGHLF